MNSAIRRLRPFMISIVALILTAGIVFAAKPSTPPGLSVAAQAAGKTVPVVTETTETTEATETTETSETSDSETGDHCATDPTTLTPEELAALNHGAVVCWAAHQPTPDGFDNHGAWVSSWAKKDAGSDSGQPAIEGQANAATKSAGHSTSGLSHQH